MTADNFLIYSIAAAVIPVFFYVWLIYWVDHYEKEPLWLLSAAFFWGAVPAALLALIFNTLFSLPFYYLLSERTAGLAAGGAIAPIVEEFTKGLALFIILIARRQELDSPLDGIIYGAMVGMGFAMVENVLYYTTYFAENGPEGWNQLVLVRGLIFGLNHALYTSLTGLGLALAAMSRNWAVRLGAPALGLLAAVTLHSLHNVAMFGGTPLTFLAGLSFGWGGVVVTIVIIIAALYQERRWIRRYLADEVGLGTLSAEEYAIVSSAGRRTRHRFGLLFSEGPGSFRRAGARYHKLSELAYRKRHHAHFNDASGPPAITALRQSITAIDPPTTFFGDQTPDVS